MRFYFGENGWPKSKLGAAPETDEEKELLVDSLQVQYGTSFTQPLCFKFLVTATAVQCNGNVPLRPVPSLADMGVNSRP